jgi:hypothetical protein
VKKTIIALLLSMLFSFMMPLNAWAGIPVPSTSNKPVKLIQPGEGETFQVGGDFINFKTLSEEVPGELSVIQVTAAPQSGPALHKHPPEVFYVEIARKYGIEFLN